MHRQVRVHQLAIPHGHLPQRLRARRAAASERRRLAQLRLRLEEYLRLGLEVVTFLVTQDRKGIS